MLIPISNIGRTGIDTLLYQYTDSPSITYWGSMGTRKHRLVWESINGPIPKDKNNRSYEIHHIDGNHNNNNISNLKLVTIQEHYDIHYSQGDWNACLLISLRMNKNPEDISSLSSAGAKKRIKNGTHHFLKGGPRDDLKGDKNPMRDPKIANKVALLNRGKTRSDKTKKKISEVVRQHPKLICKHCNKILNKVNYTNWHGDNCLQNEENSNKNRITNFTTNNPSKNKMTCEYCRIECSLPNYNRWHGKNCRKKT